MNVLRRRWRLPRRTFLRGAGVALGLPWLAAMSPFAARASRPGGAPGSERGRPPVRAAFLYFPNGMWEAAWTPKETGSGYTTTPSLEPLGKLKSEVLVLSGLDKPNSRQGDGHYSKTANFLTGMPVRKTTGKEVDVGGVSVDQLYAQKLGHLTPLPSFELAIDPVISGIDSNVGFTRLYGSYIAWSAPHVPVAREIHPRIAYERLLGLQRASDARSAKAGPHDAAKADDDRSLLDQVAEDARTLRPALGRDDQYKLDEFTDAVRAVEKQIAFFSRPDPRAWRSTREQNHRSSVLAPPPGEPNDHRARVRLMMDIMVLAFQTDATRVATFMFANDVSGRDFSALVPGAGGGHHELSHHGGKPEKYEPYAKIVRWHVEQYAYLLAKMAAVGEGRRSLLDNSLVMFGSSMSDGNRHDPNNLPVLLGGRGGGTVKTGRHLKSPKNTPLCNLYVAMLERMGLPVATFGDSTAPLAL